MKKIKDSRTYRFPRASMQSFRNHDKMFESKKDEEWILEAQVRYYENILNGSPGFISITNKRLVFEPATTSILGLMLEIDLNNIARVKKTARLLIPNSFKIITNRGTSYLFTTWKRHSIVQILNKLTS